LWWLPVLIKDPYKQKGELTATFIIQGPNITKNTRVPLQMDYLPKGHGQ